MRTSPRLIQRPHSQRTDMACPVIAGRYRVVHNIRSTDEAQFGLHIFNDLFLLLLLRLAFCRFGIFG